jgi:hypothetical protein
MIDIGIKTLQHTSCAQPLKLGGEVFCKSFLLELLVSGIVRQEREIRLLSAFTKHPDDVYDGTLSTAFVADDGREFRIECQFNPVKPISATSIVARQLVDAEL